MSHFYVYQDESVSFAGDNVVRCLSVKSFIFATKELGVGRGHKMVLRMFEVHVEC